MKEKKTVILVYIDPDGTSEMIGHILDGSLKKYHPSVTVDSSLHGYQIPMMTAEGKLESLLDNEGTTEA